MIEILVTLEVEAVVVVDAPRYVFRVRGDIDRCASDDAAVGLIGCAGFNAIFATRAGGKYNAAFAFGIGADVLLGGEGVAGHAGELAAAKGIFLLGGVPRALVETDLEVFGGEGFALPIDRDEVGLELLVGGADVGLRRDADIEIAFVDGAFGAR